MRIANTAAGLAYQAAAKRVNWDTASLPEQVVALEDLVDALSVFKGGDAVFEYGMDASTGTVRIDSVNDMLNTLDGKLRSKRGSLLHRLRGRVADLQRELLTVRLRMGDRGAAVAVAA